MNILSAKRSSVELQRFLLSNKNILHSLIAELKLSQLHYSRLAESFSSRGISDKIDLQTRLEDILDQLKMVLHKLMVDGVATDGRGWRGGEVGQGDGKMDDRKGIRMAIGEGSEGIEEIDVALDTITDNHLACVVLEVLVCVANKWAREFSIAGRGAGVATVSSSHQDFSIIKDLIQSKHEAVIERRAMVEKMKKMTDKCHRNRPISNYYNDDTATSGMALVNSKDPAVQEAVKSLFKKSSELQCVKIRVGVLEGLLERHEVDVVGLKEKRLLCVTKRKKTNDFERHMSERHTTLNTLKTTNALADLKLLQIMIQKCTDSVTVNAGRECPFSKFPKLIESEFMSSRSLHVNDLRMLRVVDDRPMEVFDLSTRDQVFPVIQDTMQQLRALYNFPDYKSPDMFLTSISFNQHDIHLSHQHHLDVLLSKLRDSCVKVEKQNGKYLHEYQGVLEDKVKLASMTVAHVNVVQQDVMDWWVQPGLLEGTRRKVDEMTGGQWMDVLKAHLHKLRYRQ